MITALRGIKMGIVIALSKDREALQNQMLHIFRLNNQLVELRTQVVKEGNPMLQLNVLEACRAYDTVEKQMFDVSKMKHTAQLLRTMLYDVEAEWRRYSAWKTEHLKA